MAIAGIRAPTRARPFAARGLQSGAPISVSSIDWSAEWRRYFTQLNVLLDQLQHIYIGTEIAIGAGAETSSGSIMLGRNADPGALSEIFAIGSPDQKIVDHYFGEGPFHTSGAVVRLNASSGSGTNIAGMDLEVCGGRPTGSGVGGNVKLRTAPAGATGTALRNLADRLTVDHLGNVVIGTAALATTATDGFFYTQSSAGAPTGTPTTFTGRVATIVDTTNLRAYFYIGGTWRYAALT